MWLILQVLGWGLLLLLLSVVLLVALPMRVALNGELGEVRRLRVTLGLLGGVVPSIALYDSDKPKRPRKNKEKKKAQRRKLLKGGGSLGMATEFPTLLRELLQRVHLEKLHLRGRFGLGDPADTGAVFGMLTPLIYGLSGRRAVIELRPDFGDVCLEGRLEAGIRLTPIAFVPPILRYVWRVFGPRQ